MRESTLSRGRTRLAAMAAVATAVAVSTSYAAGALTDRSDATSRPASAESSGAGPTDLTATALDTVDPGQVKLAFDNFPTTLKGLTYGSDAQATTIDEAPDLIAVAMDTGRLGFVRKTDLWADPSSPEEAAAHEKALARNRGIEVLPAYDLAGNQIGTSSSQPSSVSYDSAER